MLTLLLYQEWLRANPWDQLLAASVLLTVLAVPVIVKIGSGMQERRTERLRAEFGDDYDRAVEEHGHWLRAESALIKRRRTKRAAEPRDTAGTPR